MLFGSKFEGSYIGDLDPGERSSCGPVDRHSLVNVFGYQVEQGNPMSLPGKPERVGACPPPTSAIDSPDSFGRYCSIICFVRTNSSSPRPLSRRRLSFFLL